MKTAVIFPGIGYHTDKPLLYYAKKLAVKYGFEIKEVPYKNHMGNIKGDAKKMREAFESAMAQTEEILENMAWDETEGALFISKSIGTIIAAAYAAKHKLNVRHVYYTPLKETFMFAAPGSGIAFHGTADSWAEDADIEAGCREKDIPLIIIPDANHSLETGSPMRDVSILANVMEETRIMLNGLAPEDYKIERIRQFRLRRCLCFSQCYHFINRTTTPHLQQIEKMCACIVNASCIADINFFNFTKSLT